MLFCRASHSRTPGIQLTLDTEAIAHRATRTLMASDETAYEERLRLADSIEGYQKYLGQAHFLLLVQEALEETRGGAEKIKYILALASRCKSGLVSIELLAKKIDKEYSSRPLLREKEVEVKEWRVGGSDNMDTDTDEAGDQNSEAQDTGMEEEV